jgi:hypothetical protein
MAACPLAHHDVTCVIVDDDADTDFGTLRFRHYGFVEWGRLDLRFKRELKER